MRASSRMTARSLLFAKEEYEVSRGYSWEERKRRVGRERGPSEEEGRLLLGGWRASEGMTLF